MNNNPPETKATPSAPSSPDPDDNYTYTWKDSTRPLADLPDSFYFFPLPPSEGGGASGGERTTTSSTHSSSSDLEDFIEGDFSPTTPLPLPPPPPLPPPLVDERNNNLPCFMPPPPPPPTTLVIVETQTPPTPTPTTTNTFIWSQTQARTLSSRGQSLGPSSCGLIALLDVLTSLHQPLPTPATLTAHLRPSLRANTAPLAEYLLSRSKAGTTAAQLIAGMESLTGGKIVGKFFRIGEGVGGARLGEWLAGWMRMGCTPIATLNPQALSSASPLPDAWHHQMIHGLSTTPSTTTVHLTHPLCCVDIELLLPQLRTPSVLLVRREDVVGRVTEGYDLRALSRFQDERWNWMNVLGFTAHLLHEEQSTTLAKKTPHLPIPADYVAGISLFGPREMSELRTTDYEIIY